jgi:hypothetical protein
MTGCPLFLLAARAGGYNPPRLKNTGRIGASSKNTTYKPPGTPRNPAIVFYGQQPMLYPGQS